jgi:hypothetical protein
MPLCRNRKNDTPENNSFDRKAVEEARGTLTEFREEPGQTAEQMRGSMIDRDDPVVRLVMGGQLKSWNLGMIGGTSAIEAQKNAKKR